MINTLMIEIERARRDLESALNDVMKLTEREKRNASNHVTDNRDPDEACDGIPHSVVVKEGLCEIAGLVNRARRELSDGNLSNCSTTLGRIANAIDRELNAR